MGSPAPSEIVRSFVEAINSCDVEAIVALLTDDHQFVDSLGHTVQGREAMRGAWDQYFRIVPNYAIAIEETVESDQVVILLGTAHGTYSLDGELDPENRWQTPAAWKAVVRAGKLSEWRVYSDNEPVREVMRRLAQTG